MFGSQFTGLVHVVLVRRPRGQAKGAQCFMWLISGMKWQPSAVNMAHNINILLLGRSILLPLESS